jgi:hypothetical protein
MRQSQSSWVSISRAGKVAVEIGLALDAGGEEMAMLAGNGDGAAQERFAGIDRRKMEDVVPGENVIAFEKARDFEARGQIVARDHEDGGLARRDETAVRDSVQPAELGEPAFRGSVLTPEHVEELGTDQRN